jgi:hypothetical protein
MVDAAIYSSYLLVVHIAKYRGETNPVHPWLKYSGRNRRMIFQLDLAHSLMEKGLLMDCPDAANFKKPKLRRSYSRKQDYHQFESDKCFFCKYSSTYGVQHSRKAGLRWSVPPRNAPVSPWVPATPPSQHPTKIGAAARGYCAVCQRETKRMRVSERQQICKLPNWCNSDRLGCPMCNDGKGVSVCKGCWTTYRHNLKQHVTVLVCMQMIDL